MYVLHFASPALTSGIKKGEFDKQPSIVESLKQAKSAGSRLHLLGLISDGGVHSHIQHVFSLIKCAKAQGVEHIYIHFFGDGRDTAPRSATKYIKQLQDFIQEQGVGEISTVVGRYYAMDRDKRWDRIKIAVDGLVQGQGDKIDGADLIKTVEDGYAKDITDEFIKPIISGSADSRIKGVCRALAPADRQMAILCSSSTTALTECENSSRFLGCPTSLWRCKFLTTWYVHSPHLV